MRPPHAQAATRHLRKYVTNAWCPGWQQVSEHQPHLSVVHIEFVESLSGHSVARITVIPPGGKSSCRASLSGISKRSGAGRARAGANSVVGLGLKRGRSVVRPRHPGPHRRPREQRGSVVALSSPGVGPRESPALAAREEGPSPQPPATPSRLRVQAPLGT